MTAFAAEVADSAMVGGRGAAGSSMNKSTPHETTYSCAPLRPMSDSKEVPEIDTNVFKLAANGDLAGVKRLAEQSGFDVNASDPTGMSALAWAARNGNVDVMAFLIDKSASIEALSPGGLRPVHHACNFSREDALKLLFDKGADLTAVDDAGCTPMHWCVAMGSPGPACAIVHRGTAAGETERPSPRRPLPGPWRAASSTWSSCCWTPRCPSM